MGTVGLQGLVVLVGEANDDGHGVDQQRADVIFTVKKVDADGDGKNDKQRIAA